MPELAGWLADLQSGDAVRAEFAASNPPADQEKTLEALKPVLESDDADLRWWATRALAEIGLPHAGELLSVALHDRDSSVQHCAALGLRQRPHPAAIEKLVVQLKSEDRLLARLCGDALAALGEKATPALLEVLQSENDTARVEAARALAAIGDLNSVSALFQLLDNDSAILEHWASEGLEKMGIGMQFFSTSD